MKQYAYYPGCSLESLAKDYQLSTLEVARTLGLEMKEIEDWNCCGATAYFPVDELLAYTLVARNLAIAEKTGLTDFRRSMQRVFQERLLHPMIISRRTRPGGSHQLCAGRG